MHYLCKLQAYGHQICTADAFDVDAPTDLLTPCLTYFPGSQVSKCNNQIFGQLWWHKLLTLHTGTYNLACTDIHEKLGQSDLVYGSKLLAKTELVWIGISSHWASQSLGCLFRPTGPASAGLVGLYILLLYFLSFFLWPSSVESRPIRRPPTLHQQCRPSAARKLCTDIRPMLLPFFTGGGGKMSQILTPVVFKLPYFWTGALYRKTKTNLSRTDDRSTTAPNLGSVGPPNSQNRWRIRYPKGKKWNISYISSIPAAHAAYSATNVIPTDGAVDAVKKATVPYLRIRPLQFTWGSPKRVKVINFLYILRSSVPRLPYRHQWYTTYWGRRWCKKSTVPYLAICPQHFTGGKNQQPTLG